MSSSLYACNLLHYFCVCQQGWWTNQLVLITSTVATDFTTFVCNIYYKWNDSVKEHNISFSLHFHTFFLHRYAIYLVHFSVIMWTTTLIKSPIDFNEITAIQSFLGNFILSFLVAIPATLAFELPIAAIEKLTSKSSKERTKQQTPL